MRSNYSMLVDQMKSEKQAKKAEILDLLDEAKEVGYPYRLFAPFFRQRHPL